MGMFDDLIEEAAKVSLSASAPIRARQPRPGQVQSPAPGSEAERQDRLAADAVAEWRRLGLDKLGPPPGDGVAYFLVNGRWMPAMELGGQDAQEAWDAHNKAASDRWEKQKLKRSRKSS